MAHETHHDTHHADAHSDHHHVAETRPTNSYWSAFWFVLILVGLFIGAVNFVGAMSHDEEGGHGGGHNTEATHETGTGHTAEGEAAHATEHATEATTITADTAHAEAHGDAGHEQHH